MGQLLHLVGRVAALEVAAQGPALDGLREDDRGLALVLAGRAVGGVHLAVVVAASLESPDLVVCHRLDKFRGSWVASEEVFANECAVFGLIGLVVAVGRVVHQRDQGALGIQGQQLVPAATPDDLDDVPAGAPEERLEFLDDLAFLVVEAAQHDARRAVGVTLLLVVRRLGECRVE